MMHMSHRNKERESERVAIKTDIEIIDEVHKYVNNL